MDRYDVCATYYDWSNVAIGYLREFLDTTGYYIVIHSSWRKYNDLEKCKALFALYGMEDYVIDLVRIEEKEIAIAKYVEIHKNEIENYIVIDDDDYTKYFGRQFLKTRNSNMKDSKELDCINKLGYLTDLTSVDKEGIRHNLAVIPVNGYSSLQCSKFLSNNREFLIQQCEMNGFYV